MAHSHLSFDQLKKSTEELPENGKCKGGSMMLEIKFGTPQLNDYKNPRQL